MESLNLLYRDSNDLDVARQRIEKYPRDQILMQVFAGGCDRAQLEKLHALLIENFPSIAILGTTTEGEIFECDVTENQILLSFSFFDDTKVKTHFCEDTTTSNPVKLAENIKASDSRIAIMYRSGSNNGQLQRSLDYLQGIGLHNPNLILAGGQAGIGAAYVDTFVFTENFFSNNGTVVATLAGSRIQGLNLRIDGWEQIGREMQLTKSEGTRVYEIDNRSVADIYDYYLGVDIDVTLLQNPTLEFPLACVRDGMLMKNIPVINHDDGGMEFLFPFKDEEKIKFSYCDISKLDQDLEHLQKRVAAFAPEAMFIYSCSGRKAILGHDINMELNHVRNISSCAGFFTSSEFFSGSNFGATSLIQNMTLLLLSEREEQGAAISAGNFERRYSQKERQSRKTLKILTNLISATSRELEASNRMLADMASLDSMTGLLNRRAFDEKIKYEIKRHVRSREPLSFILLDVDFFKQYNDLYGHVAGDECLETIGAILGSTLLRATDMAFRYGGEEMCCLMPSTDFDGARQLAERLRRNVEDAAISHDHSSISRYLTVSIGFMTYHFQSNEAPHHETVIKACDDMLYQAKEGGRNRIVGDRLNL